MLRKIVIYICHVFILFGFLFEIPIVGPITTRRLSLIVAIVTLIFYKSERKEVVSLISNKKIKQCLVFFGICFLLAVFNSMGVLEAPYTDYFEPWYIIYIILYSIVFAVYCVTIFKNTIQFAVVYISCFFIQTIAVYAAVLSTPIRLILYELFYSGDDRFEKTVANGSRIMGIALHSAAGSVICCTSIVLLCYLVLNNKISRPVFYICSAALVSMTAFIARTGLLIELLLISITIFFDFKKTIKYIPIILFSGFLGVYLVLELLSNSDSGTSDFILEWIMSGISKNGRSETMEGIHQELPTFDERFILGTSVMRGNLPRGGYIASDCGYVMILSAIGFFGAIFYYLANLKMYLMSNRSGWDKTNTRFINLLILISFIIEYKEPFMMKYIFSFIILSLSLFHMKEIKESNYKSVN